MPRPLAAAALLFALACTTAPMLHAADTVVVSCPNKKEQKLLSVYLFQMPEGHVVHGSAGVRGTEWDLSSIKLDAGQHLVLDCGYGPQDAPRGTRANPKDVVVKKVPETAGRCYRSYSPVSGKCFAK